MHKKSDNGKKSLFLKFNMNMASNEVNSISPNGFWISTMNLSVDSYIYIAFLAFKDF